MTKPVFMRWLQHCLVIGLLTTVSPCVLGDTPEAYVKLAEQAFDRSDIVSAMAYYRKAANLGYAPAQNRLAYLLDKSEENEEAIAWYQKAAAQDEPEAQYELARLYAAGEGIDPDFEQAYQLFTKSAEKMYAPAIRVLALAHEQGELGQRIDYEQSRYWLQRGQQINDYWSIKRLATAYREGELGLRIDREKSQALEQQLKPLSNKGGQ